MHTLKRAVIMAAGAGDRLHPLTGSIPKPLIPVNGTRMIDTLIRALRVNGITEIYVVVGYKKEQFSELPAQYPGLSLIENPYYATCNNISSAFIARAHLCDAVLADADLILRDPRVFLPTFERSCYCAYPICNAPEWSLVLDDTGVIKHCEINGCIGTHQLIGISFWTEADSGRLAAHLEQSFVVNRRRDVFWDTLPLIEYADAYALGVREIDRHDIQEIDTPADLVAADPSYAAYFQRHMHLKIG